MNLKNVINWKPKWLETILDGGYESEADIEVHKYMLEREKQKHRR